MDRFIVNHWRALPPEERAQRCRLMAEEALSLANASPQMAKLYFDVAEDWFKLAAEFEQPS